MTAEITIPPAALEAAARKITAVTMGLANVGDRLPDTLWKQYLPEARAACIAMLRAWETDTHRMIVGTALDEVGGTYPAIILPLKEKQNAEA